MGTYSSGEELVIKPRKPYTVTKQRERWTEEEHNRFLEALKLYGRAWQRIEEHIGTKTAVQIRSHAQKFFSKLEKEALDKGLPVGQALDINIPPPRPKRKPSNPRKTGTIASVCQLGAKAEKPAVLTTSCGKEALDLEKEPFPESSNGIKRPSTPRDTHGRSHSEAVPLFQEVTQESDFSNASNLTSCCIIHERPVAQDKDSSDSVSPPTKMQGIQNHPQHIPVHFADGNLPICSNVIHPGMQIQNPIFRPLGGVQSAQLNLNADPAVTFSTEHQNNAPRPANQTYSTFHPPFTLICPNLEEYQSFLQASSTFSSLIVSTLLQNPAAYSAASFAASLFPYANKESLADLPKCGQEGFRPKQEVSTPSMAAIVAATVAAATAWWVAHGLLPVYTPLHSPFPFPPVSTCLTQPMDSSQVQGGKENGEHDGGQNPPTNDKQIDPEQSTPFEAQHSPAKSQTSSSLDSERSDMKLHDASKTIDCDNVAAENDFHDANKTKGRKQVDRSSCGSNAASSSDVETDTFEKNGRGKEVPEEVDNHPTDESSCRCSKSTSNMSDSWKEVSEEGRLAFQALFSRVVLPQSFSSQHNHENKDHDNDNGDVDEQTQGKKSGDEMTMDLNDSTGRASPYNEGSEKHALTGGEANCNDCLLILGLGHGRLKGRRTGFKPYKRCSVEARESRVSSICGQGEEKVSKKIRLEGEAST